MNSKRLAAGATAVALLCLLAACAGERSYRDGQELLQANRAEEALTRYRQALQSEPNNARFRIGYLNARDQAVARWLDDAERKRRAGDQQNEARALYNRVLSVDEGNSRAREGLVELERDRRISELMARASAELKQGNVELALSRLRSVLSERPRHTDALALLAQAQEMKSKPKVAADAKLAEAFRKPVSLEFRDAQLKQVFEVLSRSSGLNFVLDKDVRGDQRTTLFLRNTTVSDAVALATLTNQLEHRVLDANTVLVFPNTPVKLREYQQLNVKTFVLSSGDAKAVAATLKAILKAKDVIVDEKQNMIVMRDSPEALLMAEKLVVLHDQPEAEVMLDVEILEIKRSRLLQYGVQYPQQVAFAPMTGASGVQLTVADLKNITAATTAVSDLSIGVQATSTIADVNVLANPRIRSRNKEKAKIQVGQRVPNITSTSTSTGFVAETVQYVDVGLKLEVEPTVSPDGEVAIKVGLEVSNILRQIQTKGGSIAYEIGTRNASTVLRLRDGENQVLAGLINDEDRRSVTGLPGLNAVPLVGGALFGNTQDDVQKSEIVLSITPRIVRAAFKPDLSMSEFESGTEASLRSRGAEFTAPSGTGTPVPAASPQRSSPAGTKPPATQAPGTGGSNAAASLSAEPSQGAPAPAEAASDVPPAANSSADRTPAPEPNDARPPSGLAAMFWRGTNSVAAGGNVSIELWANTSQPLAVVPATLTYDPRVLSIVSVDAGNFFSNAGTNSTLSKRAEPGSGEIRAVLSSSGGTPRPAEGSVIRITFRALSAADSTRVVLTEAVRAMSPTGEMVVLASPPEWLIKVR
jgi:general secretion pathway protein D